MEAILDLLSLIVVIGVAVWAWNNNREQIESQKKILIAQFKKAELDKLNLMLGKPLEEYMTNGLDLDITIFGKTGHYFSSFLSLDNSLFPVLKSKDVIDIRVRIVELLNDMIGLFEHYNNPDELAKNDFDKFESLINSYSFEKDNLIFILFNSIIEEISNQD
jgi:hypothetical protein